MGGSPAPGRAPPVPCRRTRRSARPAGSGSCPGPWLRTCISRRRGRWMDGPGAVKVWYIMARDVDTARVSPLVHAAGDEARKVGLPLIVHATGLWEAKDAVRAGATLLVHSVVTDSVDAEFLRLARERGTAYTPTLRVVDGYTQVAARRFARDRQPLACVDPETRARALATDTVAL